MAKKKRIRRQRDEISIPENVNTKKITVRPRVFAISRFYNIGVDTLLEFLDSKGYWQLSQNSLLDTKAIELIDQKYKSDKAEKDKLRGATTIEFIKPKNETLSNTFQNKSDSKEYREPILHLTHDIFNQTKQKIFLQGHQPFTSNFNDNEVINICSKMSSSFTRKLCTQLNNPKVNKSQILYQLHFIANKALTIFGSKILSFIYGLRNLKFKDRTASEIQTYKNVIPDFPIISFDTGETSLKISFFVKQSRLKNKQEADMRVYAPKTNEQIGSLDNEGYIMARLKKFKPQLTLFYQSTDNNIFKIFSGVESGECEICGKELSHPISLRIGIGPVCAKNSQIDRTLYKF